MSDIKKLLARIGTARDAISRKDEQTSLDYMIDGVLMNCSVMLKEQEAKWIYGEDETGADGWHCSKCNFFEPWFYDYDDDIDFIKRYEHCPKCGRKMTI